MNQRTVFASLRTLSALSIVFLAFTLRSSEQASGAEYSTVDGPPLVGAENFFYNLYGFAKAEDPVISKAGDLRVTLMSMLSSEAESDNLFISGRGLPASPLRLEEPRKDAVFLDYESIENYASVRVGVGGGFELGLDASMIKTGSNHVDGFIYDYHDVFGLPQGIRVKGEEGRNILRIYHYDKESLGFEVLDQTTDLDGLSKVFASVSLEAYNRRRHGESLQSALRLYWKIPARDKDKLYSSGKNDFYANISAKYRKGAFTSNIGAGALLAGKTGHRVLKDIQKDFAYVLQSAFSYTLTPGFAAKAHLNYTSPLFESSSFIIGQGMLTTGAGFSLAVIDQARFELYLIEDFPVFRGAIDVSLQGSVTASF